MGSRRKARECALQMLFAADFADAVPEEVLKTYWVELGDSDVEETAREFATRLAAGTLSRLETLDEQQPQVDVQHEEVEPPSDDELDDSTGDEHSEASS